MDTDPDMKIEYAVVLEQLKADLDGIEGRRQALAASIAAMSRLVEGSEQEQLFPNLPTFNTSDPSAADVKLPAIPPGHFSRMSPTEGYRDLMSKWPGYYTPPQIAGMFMAGGMKHKSRTQLVQSVHSVLKRERQREHAQS